MKLFKEIFNFKGNAIDDALAIISKVKLHFTSQETINDANQDKVSDCVNRGQVYSHIAKSLGYDVQFVHVKCRVSETGHIRLRPKHQKRTGGNRIDGNRGAVADTTSGNVKAIWCSCGYLTSYDPS